jgi:hypothetical protein
MIYRTPSSPTGIRAGAYQAKLDRAACEGKDRRAAE